MRQLLKLISLVIVWTNLYITQDVILNFPFIYYSYGRTLFDRPKPTVDCSVSGRRRRTMILLVVIIMKFIDSKYVFKNVTIFLHIHL